MDQQNFINGLREVRSNLYDALSSAERMERKLLGPRPSNPCENAPKPSESVASLLGEIFTLSVQLPKALAQHHSVIGEFAEQGVLAQPSRFA